MVAGLALGLVKVISVLLSLYLDKKRRPPIGLDAFVDLIRLCIERYYIVTLVISLLSY